MQSGRMRHVAVVQRQSTTLDSHGQAVVTWVRLLTLYCDVRMLSGRELEQAKQKSAVATHRVDSRWLPGIDAKDRLIFRGRELYISSVENVGERDREMILLCGEQA